MNILKKLAYILGYILIIILFIIFPIILLFIYSNNRNPYIDACLYLHNISFKELEYRKKYGCYTNDILSFEYQNKDMEKPIKFKDLSYHYAVLSGDKLYYLSDTVPRYFPDIVECSGKLKSEMTCNSFEIYLVLRYFGKPIYLSVDETMQIEQHECPKGNYNE